MLSNDGLRIAVPSKGRLQEAALELLRSAGLRFRVSGRGASSRPCSNSVSVAPPAPVATPPGAFTGVDTFDYTISDGQETATATVTVTVASPSPVGDPAAGQAGYDAECSVCHAAGAHDTTTAAGGNDLGGRGQALIDAGLLVNDLGITNAIMNGITMTDQEILDMAAFLDTL